MGFGKFSILVSVILLSLSLASANDSNGDRKSWKSLQYDYSVPRIPSAESDIIIGVVDTGIWPEHESFRDDALGPPPAKWKGPCHGIKCNNKLIGARYYGRSSSGVNDCNSPVDRRGHGTHVASIAAGQNVQDAELFGLGKGTIRGVVPRARIAVYKMCSNEDDVFFRAIKDAVDDGVDVVSISMSLYNLTLDYPDDPVAVGAFYAMKHGVLTSVAAGNEGPAPETVRNVAPWMLSVAATTTDRRMVTKLSLGDGTLIEGTSINTYDTETNRIVYLGDIGIYPPRCDEAIDDRLIQGNIVLCTGPYNTTAKLHGARGVVILSTERNVPYQHDIPSISVDYLNGMLIRDYIFHRDKSAKATIHKSEVVFDGAAPTTASFSSRGPNMISPQILKPDISAPGVGILAAWPEGLPLAYNETDLQHKSRFNMISGTSMACPYASGAAAYVKSLHPTWSPAAIMSAIMTTASPMTPRLDLEFAYGAGMLNPALAPFPGLVFDAGVDDYIFMLCRQGYRPEAIRAITRNETFSCPDLLEKIEDFNYPSTVINLGRRNNYTEFRRTVTNVGDANSVYTWMVRSDSGIRVSVEPKEGFKFTKLGEKKSFVASVSTTLRLRPNSLASAALILNDGKHRVKFPIVVQYSG